MSEETEIKDYTEIVTRKEQVCWWCRTKIERKDRCYHSKWSISGKIRHYYLHVDCYGAMKAWEVDEWDCRQTHIRGTMEILNSIEKLDRAFVEVYAKTKVNKDFFGRG